MDALYLRHIHSPESNTRGRDFPTDNKKPPIKEAYLFLGELKMSTGEWH